jgi:hypothetical protein
VSGASGCGFTASRFGKKAKTIPNWKKYIQAARVPVMARERDNAQEACHPAVLQLPACRGL